MSALAKLAPRIHIAIYKATGGKLGGKLGPMDIALLTTTGRKSGQPRTTPLSWFSHGESVVIVASANGSDANPAWYLNLTANPTVTVQRGRDEQKMTARTASAEEKAIIWPEIVARAKNFQSYAEKTKRDIPLVILTAGS